MADATLGGGPPLPADQISDHDIVSMSVTAAFTFLSTVCVAVRFASRRITRSIGWDDWTSLGALIFSYGYLISEVFISTVARGGFHSADYTANQFGTYLKVLLVETSQYNFSIALSKISLLVFYRRIFNLKSFRITVWISIGIVISFWLTNGLGLVLAYSPVRAQWDFWLKHSSINIKAFWMSMGIINVVIDFGILCLPQIRVCQLHLSAKRRILLSLLFLVGFFTCVASIVRIICLNKIDSADLTYTVLPAGIWTVIEMNMSIMCGCAPTFPHFFRHWYDSGTLGIFGLRCWVSSSKFAWFNCFRRGKLSGSLSSLNSGHIIQKTHSPSSSTLRTECASSTGDEAATTDDNHKDNDEGFVHVRTEVRIVHVDRLDYEESGDPSERGYGW